MPVTHATVPEIVFPVSGNAAAAKNGMGTAAPATPQKNRTQMRCGNFNADTNLDIFSGVSSNYRATNQNDDGDGNCRVRETR